MLQVRRAARAKRYNGVVLARERRHVLARHVRSGLGFAKHRERESTACLLHRERHFHTCGGENLHRRDELLRVGEVLRAPSEERYLELGLAGILSSTLLQLRPHVPERLLRKSGQRLEPLLAEEHHRQVAHESVAPRERPMREVGEPQESVEQLAVLHRERCELRGKRRAVLAPEARANLLYERRQVDAAGADVLARTATDAVLAEGLRDLTVVEEVREHEADCADVDVPHAMPAHEAEYRAYVRARAAAHAAEHLREKRILRCLRAPVVEEDDMQYLPAGRTLCARSRAVDERDVGSETLRGGVARQHLKRGERVVDLRHQLVQTGERHVHARERVDKPSVALVRDDCDAARLGDAEVGA